MFHSKYRTLSRATLLAACTLALTGYRASAALITQSYDENARSFQWVFRWTPTLPSTVSVSVGDRWKSNASVKFVVFEDMVFNEFAVGSKHDGIADPGDQPQDISADFRFASFNLANIGFDFVSLPGIAPGQILPHGHIPPPDHQDLFSLEFRRSSVFESFDFRLSGEHVGEARVPEPSALAALGAGIAFLAYARRRCQDKAAPQQTGAPDAIS